MRLISSNRARRLAICVVIAVVSVPALVSAAPISPSRPGQPGDAPQPGPAACPADIAVEAQPAMDTPGTREHPAPLGTIVPLKNGASEYRIGISEVVRGRDAWKRIQKYDANNPAPADGKEYIMIFVVVRYVSGPDSAGREFCFNAITRNQVVPDLPVVSVRPDFKVEYTSDIPGGGWIVGEVYPDDPNPLLMIGLGPDGRHSFYFETEDQA
jgi:hypothetical protein